MEYLSDNEMLRSKKSYKPGFIFREEPYAYVVNSEYLGKVCNNCFKRTQLKTCSNCKSVYYCTSKCQIENWNNVHKYICKYLKMKPDINPQSRTVLSNFCHF
ncbi:hypothetical protein A3Q56_07252 [Intoshia linei]|uniref:MYND-type domain-containing protein n=1 Tax=Intoshia linei TaxID=1819745 RepID=A0A177ASP8_9BILA|nr:hypothetical protein A3Q56_07252 [Intoshia linei]